MLIALFVETSSYFIFCFAPEFLDTELSVFMQQLRAQGAAGATGLA